MVFACDGDDFRVVIDSRQVVIYPNHMKRGVNIYGFFRSYLMASVYIGMLRNEGYTFSKHEEATQYVTDHHRELLVGVGGVESRVEGVPNLAEERIIIDEVIPQSVIDEIRTRPGFSLSRERIESMYPPPRNSAAFVTPARYGNSYAEWLSGLPQPGGSNPPSDADVPRF